VVGVPNIAPLAKLYSNEKETAKVILHIKPLNKLKHSCKVETVCTPITIFSVQQDSFGKTANETLILLLWPSFCQMTSKLHVQCLMKNI
jgi:hypothetical protein